MYDNISLCNRLNRRGELKKSRISLFNKSLSFLLTVFLLFCIGLFVIVYLIQSYQHITIGTLLSCLLHNIFLQIDLVVIVLTCLVRKWFKDKRYSIAINVLDDDIVRVYFNEGKYMGLEYRVSVDSISNICSYKDGMFSMYCADIEVHRDNNIGRTKGVIYLKGGDAGVFISDMQQAYDRRVQFKNKRG